MGLLPSRLTHHEGRNFFIKEELNKKYVLSIQNEHINEVERMHVHSTLTKTAGE